MTGDAEIKIIPVATGSGFVAPFVAPFIGRLLVVLSVALVVGGILGSALTAVGTSLIVNGVTSMLSPQPQQRGPSGMERTDPSSLASNYSFSGITNISKSWRCD